jgi:cytochrome c553
MVRTSTHAENFAGKAVARIARQQEEYMTKALAEVAYPLSDDEITTVAHYLARL